MAMTYRGTPFSDDELDLNSSFASWFVFGKRADGSGVDLHSSAQEDVIVGLPLELANKLIELRTVFLEDVKKVLNCCPR